MTKKLANETFNETPVDINRRKAIIYPAVMGLAAAAGRGDMALAAADPNITGRGAPVRGGVLTRTLANDLPSFDSMGNSASRVILIVGPCCNGLVRYDSLDADKIIMDLAEKYEISTDGLTYTFHLRKNIKFHDGRPCTSEDVKYTFDTQRQPPKGMVSMRANLFGAVESISTPSPLTVRFHLRRKSPSFLANMANGWMVVLPRHVLEKGPMTDVIVGTGPFKLKEYKRGVSIELVRNPDYFLPDRPYLDGIKYFIIPDNNTAYGYFRVGQVDEYAPQGAFEFDRLTKLADISYVLTGTATSSNCISFNAQAKPYDDIRVRKAVCMAINRREAMETVMRGQGLATAGLALPGKWALPTAQLEKIPGYGPFKESNIAEARSLLAAAGFPNGFKDTLLVQRIPIYDAHAIYIKDKLLQIGIDLTLDFQDSAAYNDAIRKRTFRMDAGGWPFQVNDPDSMYTDSVTCDGNLNYSKICDPKIDELVRLQSQELNEKRRISMVHEIESRALNHYGTYKMYFRKITRAYRKNVHGIAVHANLDNATRLDDCWKSRQA